MCLYFHWLAGITWEQSIQSSGKSTLCELKACQHCEQRGEKERWSDGIRTFFQSKPQNKNRVYKQYSSQTQKRKHKGMSIIRGSFVEILHHSGLWCLTAVMSQNMEAPPQLTSQPFGAAPGESSRKQKTPWAQSALMTAYKRWQDGQGITGERREKNGLKVAGWERWAEKIKQHGERVAWEASTDSVGVVHRCFGNYLETAGTTVGRAGRKK